MLLAPNGGSFTTSSTAYYDIDPSGLRRQSAVYLEIALPFARNISVFALVDTGSPYCIFDSNLMSAAGVDFAQGETITLSTRVGQIRGKIQRLPLVINAEEGNPLLIDASVFVTSDWYQGHFLGYGGFLERLRFAIDPLSNTFYFGPADQAA